MQQRLNIIILCSHLFSQGITRTHTLTHAGKFCVGTTDGEILVCSYQDGVPLKSVANPAHKHKREVVSLLYNDEDKCLLTTAWDRRLCVWDENPREEVELLRMTHNAHQADILCMAHSRRLSLIATGSTDLLVHVFDFEFCKQLAVLEGHPAEVTCMSFVDPYALLVSGDASGMLIFWQLRPLRWAKIAMLRNDQELPRPGIGLPAARPAGPRTTKTTTSGDGQVGTTGVLVMDLLECKENSDVHLYTGDEKGIVRCWDISVLVSELVVPAEKKLLSNKSSYNPNRRLQHSGDENTDLVHVGKLYKTVPGLNMKLDASMNTNTISISTRAKRLKKGNPTVKLTPIPAAPAAALGPRLPKRNLISHLPRVVPLRPATALETKRFSLVHKWKAHYDTIKSLQVYYERRIL